MADSSKPATFTVRGLNQLIRRAHAGFDPARDMFLDDCADEFVARAEETAPVGKRPNTDRLKHNHHVEQRGSGPRRSLVLVNTKPYAVFVQKGTPAHTILPRRPAYALFWPGARHPVARVNHPGTKPNDWMDRAVRKATPAIEGKHFTTYTENARRIWDASYGGSD
jgi:hypothetical protein